MSGAKQIIEEMKRKEYEKYVRNQSECDSCKYTFNKSYEDKCPMCSTKARRK